MELSYEDDIVEFDCIAMIPSDGMTTDPDGVPDNVGICTRAIRPGSRIRLRSGITFKTRFSMPEGHRFALVTIVTGELLQSWGLPFGIATSPMRPGDYLANQGMLNSLKHRIPKLALPSTPNFADYYARHTVRREGFLAVDQIPLLPASEQDVFRGYLREGGRGTGTRNVVAIISTTSLSAGFARRLAADTPSSMLGIDAVEAVTHSEAGGRSAPNNLPLLMRTIAHWVIHPNVAAALVIDYGHEVLTCAALKAYMEHPSSGLKTALKASHYKFLTLTGDFEADIKAGRSELETLLPLAATAQRTARPLSELCIALQCGGSDAFSGVSGNPLVGLVAKMLIERGGKAVQAETDELIGAEPYFLARCASYDVASDFLSLVQRFKIRLKNHSETAEGNPSGGNLFRGLYNIALKSLGAGMKKAPTVRLDGVGEYGERMVKGRGFYFMDSPGNDLESIAGQVA